MAPPLLAQTPTPPPALDRQWLAGTWKLDKSGPPEDEKNWNRFAVVPKGTPPPVGPPSGGTNARQERETTHSLRCFGEKLMIGSDSLVIGVGPGAITIDDDFREPTRYGTSQTTTIQVATDRIRKDIVPQCLVSSFDVRIKTSWNGDALVQELWTRDLLEIVRITRTFIPVPDGRKMLLVIKVLEPKLKEPVKDIERVYVRQPS
jgi:hypothetical protein